MLRIVLIWLTLENLVQGIPAPSTNPITFLHENNLEILQGINLDSLPLRNKCNSEKDLPECLLPGDIDPDGMY